MIPLELREANALVDALHRHHRPVVGHRFSLGAITSDGQLCGAAIVGRPVARMVPKREVLEVTRLVTDGTHNACSILYAASARAAKALGYRRIQTYTLSTEGGASLRASGWVDEGEAGGGQWIRSDGRPRRSDQPTEVKTRWALDLNPAFPTIQIPIPIQEVQAPMLWDQNRI